MEPKKHIFTEMEKTTFINILKRYGHIVENKNTDGATLRAKNVAWDRITSEFNCAPHVTKQTTSKQLRRLWLNIKQRRRCALTKERQHRMATGGGPSTSDAFVDPDVTQVAPALLVSIEEAIRYIHKPTRYICKKWHF